MKLYTKIFLFLFGTLLLVGCNDLDPSTIKTKEIDEIKTIGDVKSIMRGAIDRMTLTEYYGRDYIIYGETYADNTVANGNSGRFTDIYYGNLISLNSYAKDTWETIYKTISSANLILNKKIEVSADNKGVYNHLLGEAYFVRALSHFDLLRYYGQQNVSPGGMKALGVAYETEFHPEREKRYKKRNTVGEVVKMINKDLDEAIANMDAKYDYSSDFHVNLVAAKALKVRVALYFKDYDTVLKYSDEIINSGKFSVLGGEDYMKSWGNTNSTPHTANWIFALANTPTDNRGINGLSNIYQDTGYGDVEARKLVSTLFGENDIRGLNKGKGMIKAIKNEKGEVKSYRNYGKYYRINPSDYSIPIFRYEEILMSKAEALFYKGNTAEALAIFNDINSKRGVAPLTILDKNTIIEQWRKEFYFEGFRFHTLARNDLSYDVPSAEKNVPYGNYQYAFPIPKSEMNNNPNMVQNQGY